MNIFSRARTAYNQPLSQAERLGLSVQRGRFGRIEVSGIPAGFRPVLRQPHDAQERALLARWDRRVAQGLPPVGSRSEHLWPGLRSLRLARHAQ